MPDAGLAALDALDETWTRALAIVAHPDDLEYGAASAVARWSAQGKDVRYLLVTRGEAGIDTLAPAAAGPLREAEQVAGAEEVGVTQVTFLDGFRDGELVYDLDLRRALCAAIRREQPELVVTINHHDGWGVPGTFNMADHRVVGLAVLDAVRDAANRWVFPECGSPWQGVTVGTAVAASPTPTHFVDVTDAIDAGVRSLAAHRAYLDALGPDHDMADPDTFLKMSAASAGERCGCTYAVTFELFP